MPIPTLQMSLSSSSWIVSNPTYLFLSSKFTNLSIAKPPKTTTIRMGGGPRTFPGGVSKWQWKRMQAKKAKQLLRARLARERQIYEMRKRAELTAAVTELERPWEVVEKAPKLFSTSADEQLKVLADRFQKPGGFDLWSEKDGPQLFETVDGVPSSRFFPKGVVHSIKPYGGISNGLSDDDSCRNGHDENSRNANGKFKKNVNRSLNYIADSSLASQFSDKDSIPELGLVQRDGYNENSRNANGKFKKSINRRIGNGLSDDDSCRNGHDENSRNTNEKFKKNVNRRMNYIADSSLASQFLDKDSVPELGLVQRDGYNENSRNANGKFKKSINRPIGTTDTGSDTDLAQRHGHNGNSRNANGKSKKNVSDSYMGQRHGRHENSRNANENFKNYRNGNGKFRNNENRQRNGMVNSGVNGGRKEQIALKSEVFDMSLQDDGSYGIISRRSDFK